MKRFCTLILTFVSLTSISAQQFSIQSPDGHITVTVNNSDKLSYSVSLDGKILVGESPMGFSFRDEDAMQGNFGLIAIPYVIDSAEKWIPVVKNKHAECIVPYKELTLNLKEKSGKYRRMDLVFRVMNDAVAFRYTLYGNMRVGNRRIVKELTGYSIPSQSHMWIPDFAYYDKTGYGSSQEGPFIKTPVVQISDSVHCGLPGLVKVDNENWMAILEADIDNYPGLYLGNGGNISEGYFMLDSRLAPLPFEKEDGVKECFFEKQSTPWRVIMLGHNPGKFIESEVLRSLNPDCAIEDPSWIKPGISSWDHWWSGDVKMEMSVIKEYIDLASKEGWPYALVDWTWYGDFCLPQSNVLKPAPQIDMEEIIRYATERNVGIWVWMRSEDANNNDQYKEAFKLYRSWGVKGVKIDFMDRDDQEMVNWYRRVIKEAADNHLMVDFHGAYKPDGIERTYPNMICREGVMGAEYYKFGHEKMTPEHNVALAYTRLLAGQMDYTPGGFLNVTKDKYQKGSPTQVTNTRAQELAKFVVYEAPFTVFCDHPSHVYGQIGEDFVRIVPTIWDDIRFIGGDPESYVTLAKRSGDSWFIGVINNSQPREIKLDLSFLPVGKYKAEMWCDGKNAQVDAADCLHRTNTVDSSKPFAVSMTSAGGCVAILTLVK